MEEVINSRIGKALSNKDIEDFFHNQINWVPYEEIKNFSNIDQLLYPFNACIIWYPIEGSMIGHWCAIMKRNNTIEFFNPSGNRIDALIKDPSKKILSKLFKISPYKLRYSDEKFQSDNTMTCGRHCIVRLLFSDLSEEKYASMMEDLSKKMNLNYDQLVTLMTINT